MLHNTISHTHSTNETTTYETLASHYASEWPTEAYFEDHYSLICTKDDIAIYLGSQQPPPYSKESISLVWIQFWTPLPSWLW